MKLTRSRAGGIYKDIYNIHVLYISTQHIYNIYVQYTTYMYCTYQHSTYTTYMYNIQHICTVHINTAHIINETTSNLQSFSNSIIINSTFSSELTFEHVYFAFEHVYFAFEHVYFAVHRSSSARVAKLRPCTPQPRIRVRTRSTLRPLPPLLPFAVVV